MDDDWAISLLDFTEGAPRGFLHDQKTRQQARISTSFLTCTRCLSVLGFSKQFLSCTVRGPNLDQKNTSNRTELLVTKRENASTLRAPVP